MERTLPSIIKQRIDTTANWTSKNPILLKGQIGFEITSTGEFKQKVGDGTSKWSELPYSYLTPNEIKTEVKSNQVVVPGSLNLTDNGFYVKAGSNVLMSLKADGYGVHLGTRPLMGMTINLDCHRANDTIYSLSYHGEDESNYALGWSELSAWRENDITTEITPLRILAKKIEFNPDESGKETGVILDGVATPTETLHAVNKSYVDTLTSKYLPLNGGTLSGSLKISGGNSIITLPRGARLNDGAAGFVIATSQSKTMFIKSNTIRVEQETSTNPTQIKNLESPTDSTDAANKQYVDNSIASIPTYTLPIASTTTLGGIKISALNSNIKIASDGLLSLTKNTTRSVFIQKDATNLEGIVFGSQDISNYATMMRPAPSPYNGIELLGVQVDDNNGENTNFTLIPDKSQVFSVLLSGIAGEAVYLGSNSPLQFNVPSISTAGNIVMNNHQIKTLGAPTEATDAATKQYVDNNAGISQATADAKYLHKDGVYRVGMMDEDVYLQVAGDPKSNLNLYSYDGNGNLTDFLIQSSSVKLFSSKLSFINNNGSVSGLATPTSPTEAANKAYVDSAVTNGKGIYRSQIVTSGTIADINGIIATASSNYPLVVSLTPNMIFVSAYCKFNTPVSLNSSMTIFLSNIKINGARLNFSTFTNMCSGTLTKLDGNEKLIETMTIQKLVWHNDLSQFNFYYNQQSGGVTPFTYAQVNLFAPIIT